MVWIRIFRTKSEALRAQKILEEAEIDSRIVHDKLDGIPIEKYGVAPRFRLEVRPEDFHRTAKFLLKKIKK